MWKHTADIPDAYFPLVEKMCNVVGGDPIDALGTFHNESGNSPKAHNPNGHASGIPQWMPVTLRGLGFRGANGYTEPNGAYHAALPEERKRLNALLAASVRTLGHVEQMPWVERYYRPYKGKLVSRAAWYVATFLPADLELASDPDAILVAQIGSEMLPQGRRAGVIYTANAGFDRNRDLVIQVKELDQAISRACVGPRWNEIEQRMRQHLGLQPVSVPTVPIRPDLRTPYGIQVALDALGFEVGPLDGYIGQKTRAATVAFQRGHSLTPDGIVGPLTRKALETAIASLPVES
jgi:hypothetical protein